MNPVDKKVWRSFLESLRSERRIDTVVRVEALSEAIDHELFSRMEQNSSLTVAAVTVPAIVGASIYAQSEFSLWRLALISIGIAAFFAILGARIYGYLAVRRMKDIAGIVDEAVRRENNALWDNL